MEGLDWSSPRNAQRGSWGLGSCAQQPAHTWTPYLRPAGSENLHPAAHNHPGTLNEACKDWKSVTSDQSTPQNHLWGPPGLELASSNQQSSENSWWVPWGPGLWAQQPRTISNLSEGCFQTAYHIEKQLTLGIQLFQRNTRKCQNEKTNLNLKLPARPDEVQET